MKKQDSCNHNFIYELIRNDWIGDIEGVRYVCNKCNKINKDLYIEPSTMNKPDDEIDFITTEYIEDLFKVIEKHQQYHQLKIMKWKIK